VAGQAEKDEPGILDTNVVISLPDITDPALLPEDPRISIVTLAELNVGPKVGAVAKVREARAKQLQAVEDAFDPLPLDDAVARAFGDVAASLHKRKAKGKARSIDALIAATAVANGMTLYTSNPDDFAGIEGLSVFAVPEPTRLTGWSS
jgi:tRNA(fMet)-specific endonuclease VapC